jgi:hypothetical protein
MYKCKKTSPTKPDRPVHSNPPKSHTAESLADRPPKLQEDPPGSAGSQRLARQDDAPGSMDEVIQFVIRHVVSRIRVHGTHDRMTVSLATVTLVAAKKTKQRSCISLKLMVSRDALPDNSPKMVMSNCLPSPSIAAGSPSIRLHCPILQSLPTMAFCTQACFYTRRQCRYG